MPSACAGIPRPRPRINPWLKASKFLDASLGFSAGVMLVASFTSLILPGIRYGGIWSVMIGIVIGFIFLDQAGQRILHAHFIPETHRKGHERAAAMGLMLGALVMFCLAVTLGPPGFSGLPAGRSVVCGQIGLAGAET